MVELVTVVLRADGRAFFENPAYLLGIPLLAVGGLGALGALLPIELKWPGSAKRDDEQA